MSQRNLTLLYFHVAIACLALSVGGCTRNADSELDLATTLVVPDQLPAGMVFRFGCASDGNSATALVYGGESASFRVFAFDMSARESFDDPDFEVFDVLDDAVPGSVKDDTVRGRAATAYSIAAQDPGPVVWPRLVWTEGDLAFWIWGDGLDEAAVQLVAESLRPAPTEEHLALVQEQRCGS